MHNNRMRQILKEELGMALMSASAGANPGEEILRLLNEIGQRSNEISRIIHGLHDSDRMNRRSRDHKYYMWMRDCLSKINKSVENAIYATKDWK